MLGISLFVLSYRDVKREAIEAAQLAATKAQEEEGEEGGAPKTQQDDTEI